MMSPPSCATAGRTRVSSSSFICETTSVSASFAGSAAGALSSSTGRPAVKCSMMTPSTAGLSWYHSADSSLLTVTKSVPRNTPVTPGTVNNRPARGERSAAAASGKLAVPCSITARPGRNLRVAGLGVGSVWMNMASSDTRGFGRLALYLGTAAAQVNPFANRVKPERANASRLPARHHDNDWRLTALRLFAAHAIRLADGAEYPQSLLRLAIAPDEQHVGVLQPGAGIVGRQLRRAPCRFDRLGQTSNIHQVLAALGQHARIVAAIDQGVVESANGLGKPRGAGQDLGAEAEVVRVVGVEGQRLVYGRERLVGAVPIPLDLRHLHEKRGVLRLVGE